MKITSVVGHEIFDSRGLPTLLCELILDNTISISASVPSGMSRGLHEAHELRDGTPRFMGQGVKNAIAVIEKEIAPRIVQKTPDVVAMDTMLIEQDGTENKNRLGGNTILAVSMALCRAQAYIQQMQLYKFIASLNNTVNNEIKLPKAIFNLINGGKHASSNIQVQEISIIPLISSTFIDNFAVAVSIFYTLKKLLQKRKKIVAFGDEGGIVSDFSDEDEALELLTEAIALQEDAIRDNVVIALDVAATHFYDIEKQSYRWRGNFISKDELIEWYVQITEKYPIYLIEDGIHEADLAGWQHMMQTLGGKVHIIGDDLFATQKHRIADNDGLYASGAIIKPNQVGTITETLQAINTCRQYDMLDIVSHRSGETNDSFIADLAVGVGAEYIKAGGCCRGERMAKYNRLLDIEKGLLTRRD